jgi:transitional endoplasmic reticulum ATPase
VTAQDFAEALEDSRPTVTEQMEMEYLAMRGELKRRAMEVRQIGFIHEGMLESTRDRKHGPDS